MLYAILGRDAPNSLERRLSVRPAHLERLNALLDEGPVIRARPLPAIDSPDPGPAGFQGSLMVVEFPSLEEAKAGAEADPYATAGVFAAVEVYPFRQVLPA